MIEALIILPTVVLAMLVFMGRPQTTFQEPPEHPVPPREPPVPPRGHRHYNAARDLWEDD